MRLGFFGLRPFHFPFHPSTSHTCVFLLSFMSSCLHVLPSHPFFRLRTHRPGLSVDVHIHIHFLHRFRVAQVLTMGLGSSVVPVHLVSFSLQPHTPLSRLVLLLMSSSFRLYCARTFTTVLALILFASPRGGVCVCVSHPGSKGFPCSHLFVPLKQGGSGPFSSHCLTKTLLIGCDMTPGRWSHVPAK